MDTLLIVLWILLVVLSLGVFAWLWVQLKKMKAELENRAQELTVFKEQLSVIGKERDALAEELKAETAALKEWKKDSSPLRDACGQMLDRITDLSQKQVCDPMAALTAEDFGVYTLESENIRRTIAYSFAQKVKSVEDLRMKTLTTYEYFSDGTAAAVTTDAEGRKHSEMKMNTLGEPISGVLYARNGKDIIRRFDYTDAE